MPIHSKAEPSAEAKRRRTYDGNVRVVTTRNSTGEGDPDPNARAVADFLAQAIGEKSRNQMQVQVAV